MQYKLSQRFINLVANLSQYHLQIVNDLEHETGVIVRMVAQGQGGRTIRDVELGRIHSPIPVAELPVACSMPYLRQAVQCQLYRLNHAVREGRVETVSIDEDVEVINDIYLDDDTYLTMSTTNEFVAAFDVVLRYGFAAWNMNPFLDTNGWNVTIVSNKTSGLLGYGVHGIFLCPEEVDLSWLGKFDPVQEFICIGHINSGDPDPSSALFSEVEHWVEGIREDLSEVVIRDMPRILTISPDTAFGPYHFHKKFTLGMATLYQFGNMRIIYKPVTIIDAVHLRGENHD